MLTALNHITFAVSDLQISVAFYRDLLGFSLQAKWDRGAYLMLSDCWLCLALDDDVRTFDDNSHTAFTVDENDIESFGKELERQGVTIWKRNASEGKSVYFLDPDGRRLEAHVGNLDSRMRSVRNKPYDGFCVNT